MPTSNAKQWITVTIQDVYDYLVAAQVDACNTAALGSGQTDRITEILADAQNRVRMKVNSHVTNVVSSTPETIPPELRWCVCYLAIESLQAAIPGLELEKNQRDAIERAYRALDRVADGRDLVTIPTDPMVPSEVQKGGSAQVASASRQTVNARTMRGI